ncbi:MAG: DNA-protecting protein DprA [Planctomycetes bacterium]|nr:DNA-protecting protein DprA [Planctomycetota bacterium]
MHIRFVHAFVMLALAEGLDERPVEALLAPDLDPAAALAAPPPELPPRVQRRLLDPGLPQRAAAVLAAAARDGQQVLTPADPRWPQRFTDRAQRPLALFVRGDPQVLAVGPAVAVVGSRTPTPYGADAAQELCGALAAAGTVLWSGLARGVDAAAHLASVQHATPTVAVLGGGLDRIYPPEHQQLADRILAGGGCLVSELPPGRRARRGHFVRRNRLLAMGAEAVIVIEASLTSGALHTARFAADCGTDVFALPGPWRSERSQGCHRLVSEGANLIEGPDELLRALGLSANRSAPAALALVRSADERAIVTALSEGPRPADLLQRETGLERAAFLRALFGLEQRGAVSRAPGDLWRRTGC